ncbi:MAG: DUF3667 domain-containing protein [Woeseiaceae bacterium]
MSPVSGPHYELTFQVDREAADDFQTWLAEFSDSARREERVTEARIFSSPRETPGGEIWICQLQCLNESALGELQGGILASVDADIEDRFEGAVGLSSRILHEDRSGDLPKTGSRDCLNCGTRLTGQYCGLCGQKARTRLISLWELISDAFGDLLEIDSRLWRTLIPLFLRPGQLTRDYLEGRRARYMPPFRTYLVLSLIFFVVAFFDPRDDLSLLFEPEPEPTAEEQAEAAAKASEAKKEILDELAAEGIIVGDTTAEDVGQGDEEVAEVVNEINDGLNINIDEDTGDCNVEGGDLEDLPEWFKRRFTPERIKEVCEKVTADGGKSFGDLLLDNIPVALIVLLPLMALVLKVLYPLSRRYFVEHLLFVVHYHAFFFLILIVQILFARIAAFLRIPEAIAILTIVAASLYIPVYLYMAMRHVYGQGRIMTFLKYLALVVAYNAGTALTLLGAVLFAALGLASPQ